MPGPCGNYFFEGPPTGENGTPGEWGTGGTPPTYEPLYPEVCFLTGGTANPWPACCQENTAGQLICTGGTGGTGTTGTGGTGYVTPRKAQVLDGVPNALLSQRFYLSIHPPPELPLPDGVGPVSGGRTGGGLGGRDPGPIRPNEIPRHTQLESSATLTYVQEWEYHHVPVIWDFNNIPSFPQVGRLLRTSLRCIVNDDFNQVGEQRFTMTGESISNRGGRVLYDFIVEVRVERASQTPGSPYTAWEPLAPGTTGFAKLTENHYGHVPQTTGNPDPVVTGGSGGTGASQLLMQNGELKSENGVWRFAWRPCRAGQRQMFINIRFPWPEDLIVPDACGNWQKDCELLRAFEIPLANWCDSFDQEIPFEPKVNNEVNGDVYTAFPLFCFPGITPQVRTITGNQYVVTGGDWNERHHMSDRVEIDFEGGPTGGPDPRGPRWNTVGRSETIYGLPRFTTRYELTRNESEADTPRFAYGATFDFLNARPELDQSVATYLQVARICDSSFGGVYFYNCDTGIYRADRALTWEANINPERIGARHQRCNQMMVGGLEVVTGTGGSETTLPLPISGHYFMTITDPIEKYHYYNGPDRFLESGGRNASLGGDGDFFFNGNTLAERTKHENYQCPTAVEGRGVVWNSPSVTPSKGDGFSCAFWGFNVWEQPDPTTGDPDRVRNQREHYPVSEMTFEMFIRDASVNDGEILLSLGTFTETLPNPLVAHFWDADRGPYYNNLNTSFSPIQPPPEGTLAFSDWSLGGGLIDSYTRLTGWTLDWVDLSPLDGERWEVCIHPIGYDWWDGTVDPLIDFYDPDYFTIEGRRAGNFSDDYHFIRPGPPMRDGKLWRAYTDVSQYQRGGLGLDTRVVLDQTRIPWGAPVNGTGSTGFSGNIDGCPLPNTGETGGTPRATGGTPLGPYANGQYRYGTGVPLGFTGPPDASPDYFAPTTGSEDFPDQS